jgi:hypothetical protein
VDELFRVARPSLLGLVGELRRLEACLIHARAPRLFRLVRCGSRLLGSLEIGRDLPLALFDRRLDLGDHAPGDDEEDESEAYRQPEQLRQEDFG